MILRTIYLKIGDLGLASEYTYGFLKRSRVVCNFIEREVLGRLKFKADGFKRISISLCSAPRDAAWVNSSGVACVEIPFDREVYDGTADSELCEYYIGKLKEGIAKADPVLSVPAAEISDGLERFVAGGMANQWLHLKRTFKGEGLLVFLRCELTTEVFRLSLEVHKGGVEVLREVILVTDPDENAFDYRFDDVEVISGELVVLGKRSGRLWARPIADLGSATP